MLSSIRSPLQKATCFPKVNDWHFCKYLFLLLDPSKRTTARLQTQQGPFAPRLIGWVFAGLRAPARSLQQQLVFAVLFASALLLPRSSVAETIEFNRDIRPILADRCFYCHGSDPSTREAELRLDDRDAAIAAKAIVPGDPRTSLLIQRIFASDPDEVMPPPASKKTLLQQEKELLKAWIEQGAGYQEHWAFLPPVKNQDYQGNAIDAIVSNFLNKKGLSHSPQADDATLCRRIALDLVGFPPTPEEISKFEQAAAVNRPKAIHDWIEQLMASPHFGEKWARHWLDVARYSDSNGYEKDLPREQWIWRDWVVRAFNNDMPYNQFIIEQIAGDLLDNPTQDQMIATGFLRNSMTNEEGAIIPEEFRMEELFDRMDCLGKAVLGLSLQCARCHSHKFDPISQEEYFGIFAFLNNSYEAQSWVYTEEQLKQIQKIKETIRKEEETLKQAHPDWQNEMKAWGESILASQINWTPVTPIEMGSQSGLNHPTIAEEQSILILGHPSTQLDVFIICEPELTGVTGLRLEALTYGDLPFGGPGRSAYGTWAISELRVSVKEPEAEKWTPLRMVNATADYSEPDGELEDEWRTESDKKKARRRGPVKYLIDGKNETAWRADRGTGLRHQESVAAVQFESPIEFPAGTKLKLELSFNHSGGRNDRFNTILGRLRISTTTEKAPTVSPIDHAAILALQTPPDQRTPEQEHTIFSAWRKTLPDAEEVNKKIAEAWKSFPRAETSVLHLKERTGQFARTTSLLDRGVWNQPRQIVHPHVPKALHDVPEEGLNSRLDFARWLVAPESTLTARVAVNRVWQAIFGTGLVETPEDFGTRAPLPQHSELLDWLAVDFMEHGWSHKHLIRTILTSQTYLQTSQVSPELLAIDPQNQWLARGPRTRLEAEPLRDSVLAIAGLLEPSIGGKPIYPPVPQSVLDNNYFRPTDWIPPTGPQRYRRSLYVFRKRSMPDPVLCTMDSPNGDFAVASRGVSVTPLASLITLNETIFVEAAQAMAQRVLRDGGRETHEQIDFAFRLCTGRLPNQQEREIVQNLLETSRKRCVDGELKANQIAFNAMTQVEDLPIHAAPIDIAAWTITCRVLLNLDETLTKN